MHVQVDPRQIVVVQFGNEAESWDFCENEMDLFSTPQDRQIEAATSELLIGPDWAANVEINEKINQAEDGYCTCSLPIYFGHAVVDDLWMCSWQRQRVSEGNP